MLLHSADKSINTAMNFDIIGYQFPHLKSPMDEFDYDANWLDCEFTYFENNNEEKYRDCCLLTYELEEIRTELENIISGKSDIYESDFTEPYLKISIAKQNNIICFSLKFTCSSSNINKKTIQVLSLITREKASDYLQELKELELRFKQR